MSSLAIVAIPSEDDPVWKVSSEKVPHLTLMVFGDQNDTSRVGRILDFLEHVVETSMYRFGLDVDRRGTLGDQDADVLFFKNPGYSVKMLQEVRSYLLSNRDIFEAYHSTEQFPNWLPHLTLGYPESPAKSIDRDYPIRWVTFDRVALWTGDYEGPEFELKDRDPMEVSMSDIGDIPVSDLAHFGVKGMKWGVRKAQVIAGHKKQIAETAGLIGKATKLRKDATKTDMQKYTAGKGGLHKVSDKDLNVMIKRMEMEKKYKNFMAEDSKRRAEGFKATMKLLGQVGQFAIPLAVNAWVSRRNNEDLIRAHTTVSRRIIDVPLPREITER